MSFTPSIRPILVSISTPARLARTWTSTARVKQQPQPQQVIELAGSQTRPSAPVPQEVASPATPTLDPIAPPPPIPESVEPAPISRVQRPVGAFRGGFIGFLLGMTAVGGFGYMQLLEDYSRASSLLLASVEELKSTTSQMATHLERIEHVEAEVNQLVQNASSKKEVASLRKEYKALLESEHLDAVELRARVWGIEQDLHLLSKAANSSVRI